MGMVAILVMWPWPFNNFSFLKALEAVSEEKSFKIVDGWTDRRMKDGRQSLPIL